MFRLQPPSSLGGPEDNSLHRSPSPWLMVIIVVVTSNWTPTQAALIVAILTMVALLAHTLGWSPRRA